MDNETILEMLKERLTIPYQVDMNQDRINSLIDFCIENNLKERAWRVALSFSNFDYYKLAEYYVKIKDSGYLSELLYAVSEDNINLHKIYNKILKTNDEKFINEIEEEFMSYFVVKNKDELLSIINNI